MTPLALRYPAAMKIACVAAATVVVLLAACGGDDPSSGDADGTDAADSSSDATGSVATDASPTTSASASATEGDTGVDATRPDWVHDLAPLMAEHCVSCHSAGGIAPFPLDDYENASLWAPAAAAQVAAGLMPPWHAVETDECAPPLPFKHDARLSADQIDLVVDWAAAGAPQGDPADAAPLPEPQDLDLADPSGTATMGSAVEVPAAGSTLDYFHCLSFDPGHTTDVYVDGLQVVPGNRGIVHHVLMFVDEQADSASWDGGVLEDCGGGSGVGGATLVGGWVPGSLPIETPDDVAIRLPVGARIIFNMHYHNASNTAQTDDGTGVALRWSTALPRYIGSFQLVGAPGAGDMVDAPFMIPAGATDHVERLRYEVPDLGVPEIRVFSMTNHMHKVGVDMKVTLTRGGDETCMLQTPRWDFNWQRQYLYDAPVEELPEVLPGDVVEVRCTYDNTLTNPGVAEALAEVGLDAPQDVTLGEGTLDEMCLAGVGIAVRPF